MRARVLSPAQIVSARRLREQGLSKRKLADRFNVSSTAIWENVFATKKRQRAVTPPIPSYKRIKGVLLVVRSRKEEGYTSGDIARIYDIPLPEVNRIYIQYGIYRD